MLRARGPDGSDVARWRGLEMGFTRLAILDGSRSLAELNPPAEPVTVFLNGEIWNVSELGGELGVPAAARTEYEVIRAAYLRFGPAFPGRLNGMFGIAVLDRDRDRLVLARDPVGIKPMFVSRPRPGTFAFSSDMRPLLSLLGTVTLHEPALVNRWVLGFTDYRDSLFEGIEQLPPGHVMDLDLRDEEPGLDARRYESQPLARSAADGDEDPVEGVLERLRTSLARCIEHTDSDDVGMLVSGGLDSSLLVYLARDLGVSTLRCFSVGAETAQDTIWARTVAADAGVRLEHLPVEPAAVLSKCVRFAQDLNGYPAPGLVEVFEQIRARHPGMKVVICGEGADELYAGYAYFERPVERWRRWLERMDGVPAARRTPLLERVRETASKLEEAPAGERDRLALQASLDLDGAEALMDKHLMHWDLAAMACSIEARVPYLDLETIGHASAVPMRWKVNGDGRKQVVHAALRRLSGITDPAFYRRRKVGFPAAFRQLHWELQRHLPASAIAEVPDSASAYFRSPFERTWCELALRGMRESLDRSI